MLSIWTNIYDSANDFVETVKDFFLENSRNPFLWIGIIVVGLIVFELIYQALNKNEGR